MSELSLRNKWRVLKGPELIAEVVMEDIDDQKVRSTLANLGIVLDDKVNIKIGANIIYVTGKKSSLIIDIIRV